MGNPEFLRLNSPDSIRERIGTLPAGRALPFLLLPARLVGFALLQLIVALIVFAARGRYNFEAAGAYWPLIAAAANVLTVLFLMGAFRREALGLVDLYRFHAPTVWPDLPIAIGLFVLFAPIGYLPNVILGNLLYGDAQLTSLLMFRPIPPTAAYLSVLFPLTIAFAELPFYFGYLQPRLAALLRSRSGAACLAALFLAAQHCALPLLLDWRFVAWRFGMFLPFALVIALVLAWRPRLLPYFMVGHALIDFTTLYYVISASVA